MDKVFVVLLMATLTYGCKPSRADAPRQMEPLRVEVAEAVYDSIPRRMEFVGFLASNFDAVIQPRVNGFLLTKQFSNGMPVRRGQVLFTLDPSQFSNSMLAAEAQLQSARAQAIEARNNYERAVPLAAMNAISRAELDQYTAQHKAADAAVRAAEQTLRNARLDVNYTRIVSPIDGIASGSAAHIGDYVGPGTEFNVLTTISNTDTLSVDLAIPMAQYLQLAGDRPSIYDNQGLLSDIRLTLADEVAYPHAGFYKYTRKDVAASAGTLVLVVGFPNPQGMLKPGQFARVEATVGEPRRQVVVPMVAVSQAQGINSVWVVAPDSTVSFRKVELGDTYRDLWCINEGLAAGELVVIGGRQKLRSGVRVTSEMN